MKYKGAVGAPKNGNSSVSGTLLIIEYERELKVRLTHSDYFCWGKINIPGRGTRRVEGHAETLSLLAFVPVFVEKNEVSCRRR